jgi:DNA-binding Xre family transcriptional regulator
VAKRRRLSGSLAERVGALLIEQERSVTWLAEQIGRHRTATSRIVNGKATDLPLSTVKALAVALGVSVGDLVDDD